MRVYKAFRHFFILLVLITAAIGQVNAQIGTGRKPNEMAPPTQPAAAETTTVAVQTDPLQSGVPEKSLLGSKVIHNARDSIRFDIIEQKVYLFGEADVTYESTNLKADYIELDLKNSLVNAKYGLDTAGKEIGRPVFTEGDQSFTAKEMTYNFQSKKGRITDVRTQEGDSYIHSDEAVKDSSDVYYIRHGEYTTCSLDHPHYAIRAGKLKVIPDDKIVTGPAYLKVADIPTPLAIPFGFFPNKKGQASGIIMPQYGESQNLGFFLKEGGYYFGINDTFDLALKGDIYSYGSWAVNTTTNYKIRYKFNGMLDVKYARIYYDDPEFTDAANDFKIRWIHNQDSKANPNSSFSANVDAGSSTFNRNIPGNSFQYLNNQLQSNIRYTRSFSIDQVTGSLSTNARHSQNTFTRKLTINAPELTLNINRFSPTKVLLPQKKGVIKKREIDNLGISFLTTAGARIDTYDSVLVRSLGIVDWEDTSRQVGFDDITRYGIRHSMPATWPINLGPYVTLTLSGQATYTGYFNSTRKSVVVGSLGQDSLVSTTIPGFRVADEYALGGNITTKLYAKKEIKLFKLRAIRHVLTPSAGFVYRPDRGGRFVRTISYNNTTQEYYSIFENDFYSPPSRGESYLLNWSVNNNVEMKLKDTKDTTGTGMRKVALIEGLLINGGYNFALDSFQWQPFFASGRTKLFKVVDLVANATFDPYALDTAGRRIDVMQWKQSKKLARLSTASVTVGTRLQSRNRDTAPKQSDKGSAQELEFINNNPEAFVDFNIPWSLGVNYTFRYDKINLTSNLTQTLGLMGDFSLTPKWKIGFTSNYDVEANKFSYNSLNIYRDLHCWEMSFNWVPFGPRQSYTLDIRVKAPVLSDLKLSRRRDWYDFR